MKAFRALIVLSVLVAPMGTFFAQETGEVTGLGFGDASTLIWQALAATDSYNVYRGDLSGFVPGVPGRCHGFEVVGTAFDTPVEPPSGDGYYYLATANLTAGGEGPTGKDTAGRDRPVLGTCVNVMRAHVLDRAGFGWGEWSADRIATLGIEGYVAEQLDPASIEDMQTNMELRTRLIPIDPPENITHMIQQQVVRGTYSRRQLEQQYTAYWANHFNTFWFKVAEYFEGLYPDCESPGVPPQCDDLFPAKGWVEGTLVQHREVQAFRDLGFNGNFRQMVEASALSPAMIIYLDAVSSVAGAPNENYPRELMELSAMGVDNGYTQEDIQQLSRVFTGFSFCKKAPADLDDLLAPCIATYWDDNIAGEFVAHFDSSLHDCTEKTLFAATPYEVTVPDTCGAPDDGLQDLDIVLDAIVGHPATSQFISTKILQRFVTEDPTPEMIAALVAVWNDAGNPHGVGDMRAVLAAALSLPEFKNPDLTRDKIKTPLEHFVSALRATRGRTDGALQVINYLNQAQHMPHFNPVPTGWPEDGQSWINTNNTLDRQNFGFALLESTDPAFSADVIHLLQAHGVSTTPGNAEAIVDFCAEVMLGGALTPTERQAAIEFLETDDLGNPSIYNDARIRETVALMLGYSQFQEQ